MKHEVVAIIPVREGSNRIRFKNFIPFYKGESLIDIKIKQLKKMNCIDKIYVSSDSDLAESTSKKHNVEFLLRDTEACQAGMAWSDVVSNILHTIPGNPVVVWSLTTSPLFDRFDEAISKFANSRNNSLVAVLPKKSFLLNGKGFGINYNPGFWHPYSQDLETYYEVTGGCFIAKKSDMIKWSYWFGPNPILFSVTELESIDVDYQEQFNLAKKLYKLKNK